MPPRLELVELGDQDGGIDDAAASDGAALAGDDAGRDLADLVRLVADDDRVAGVRAALVAADEIRVLREQVDDLSLPLVAPLRTDDDGRGHARQSCRSHASSVARGGGRELATLDRVRLDSRDRRQARPRRTGTPLPPIPDDDVRQLLRADAGVRGAAAQPQSRARRRRTPSRRCAPHRARRARPGRRSPPMLDTIESNDTTVARCSVGTTWCRYAERTGLVTPIEAVTNSRADERDPERACQAEHDRRDRLNGTRPEQQRRALPAVVGGEADDLVPDRSSRARFPRRRAPRPRSRRCSSSSSRYGCDA